MPRLMYDSVDADAILAVERNPQMVAGYSDTIKIPQWTDRDWKLFPNAIKVSIVKKASSNWGHVLDVEPGDATPAEAPAWVSMRRRSGLSTPTVYCNLSTWPTVQVEFTKQRVPQPLYWIARYDNKKDFPVLNGIKAVAKQYIGNDPRNIDISYVADYWPGVDGEDTMSNFDELFPLIDHQGIAARQGQDPWNLTNAIVSGYEEIYKLSAKLNVLADAVGKLSNDPDITANSMKQWVNDAIAQHLQITGTVEIKNS